MVSITEKTADKICQEFRELVELIEKKKEEELSDFLRVKNSYDKMPDDEKKGLKALLFKDAERIHNQAVESLNEEKQKYIKFIEALVIGETA